MRWPSRMERFWGGGDDGYGETSYGLPVVGTDLTRVTNLTSGVTAIAAGLDYSLAVQNGALYAWGANWHGQLGDGTTNAQPNPIPTAVTSLSASVTAIATCGYDDPEIGPMGGPDGAYYSHSFAIKNGGVYAWGSNTYGQLGNGTTIDSSVPVAVTGLSSGVTSIAARRHFGMAVRNGNLYAWGNGYLGNGTTGMQLVPQIVDPVDLTNTIEVALTGDSCFALSADGSIWDWGANEGQLGLGTNSNYEYLTPQHLLPPVGSIFTSISDQADGDSILATVAAVPEPVGLCSASITALWLARRRRSTGFRIG